MKKFFPVYPLLLGVIWVLVTYSTNATSLPSLSVVVVPLLVVTGIIAFALALTWVIVRDWNKAALIVAIIFCLTIFHGYIRDFTKTEGIAAAPIWLAFMVAGIFVVFKMTKPSGRYHLTVVANVVCIAVLCVSSYSILTTSRDARAGDELQSEAVAINSMPGVLPDIYYIIPDTYTSDYSLLTYFDYDNGDFYGFLYDRGFAVYPQSYANYHHSILSISSVLNMKYWTDEDLANGDAEVLGNALLHNPVADTMKEAGYTYVHLGSWWGFTASNVRADITPRFGNFSELSFTLYRTTIWCDLADFLFDVGANSSLREAHLQQLDNLAAVSKMEEPTFTFCHLILPHNPFLFDSSGNPTAGWNLDEANYERMYLDQLTFTTTKLEEVIDEILANSSTTPIIIISSDEGYSGPSWIEYQSKKGTLQSIMEDRPDLAVMRFSNMFAVLNPYSDNSKLKSPVNSFRVIFNELFDSNLPLLPDRYFLKGEGSYWENFIEVTGQLP